MRLNEGREMVETNLEEPVILNAYEISLLKIFEHIHRPALH